MDSKRRFNILEILDLAQKIEDNGEKFYRKAANLYPAYDEFLNSLADQEKGHGSYFVALKKKYTKDDSLYFDDPEGLIKSHLDAIADGLIFDSNSGLGDFFGQCFRPEDVMDAAIEREEETILFFQETKKLLKDSADKMIVDDLIEEENRHIVWINEQKGLLPYKHKVS